MENTVPLIGMAKSLEEESISACQDAIISALDKYNCTIVYQQMHVNGMPAEDGKFRVIKNKK